MTEEQVVEFDRKTARQGRIITVVSFLLCFPLAWLLSRLMP